MPSNNRLRAIWHGLTHISDIAPFVGQDDLSSFDRRCDAEGAEYYARGFTKLVNDLLTGIETGQLVVTARFGLKRGTCLPRFLNRAWSAIFLDDGSLREDVNADAVSCLRQLLAVFGKINGGHTPQSEYECIKAFVNVEKTIAETQYITRSTERFHNTTHGRISTRWLLMAARRRVCSVLSGSDPTSIRPKHGSGVSACSTPKWARYGRPRFVQKLHNIWPYDEYFYLSASHREADVGSLYALEGYSPCAKVLLVPKDARGPRLISCEPRETMWIQQGLMDSLYGTIESHPLTRGSVNFTDQSANRQAALKSSIDGSLATLDLSEASDRLTMELVALLFPSNWFEALESARSPRTLLPDGSIVDMLKHAPMGSACCFPVMALSIWAVLTAALPPNTRVLVYGDDIVVPTEYSQLAIDVLEDVGLKVNVNKSFRHGRFRESCGGEYYFGNDVTPTRLRNVPSDDIHDRHSFISFVNLLQRKYKRSLPEFNTMVRQWYPATPERRWWSNRLYTTVSEQPNGRLFGSIAITQNTDPLVGIMDTTQPLITGCRYRWNSRLQRREFRTLVPVCKSKLISGSDRSQLFRRLVEPTDESVGMYALPKRISYKYMWQPATLLE